MYPHRIRLRGPWEAASPGEKPRRVTVPGNLVEWGKTEGPVSLTRKFGYPGRIDSHERVWLTVDEVVGRATFTLNDKLLGAGGDSPFEHDITALLAHHNKLEIALEGSRLGEVAMEVRATAFLQNVEVHRNGEKIQLTGKVAGTCDRPLELYALVDGRHALYRTIDAGQTFQAELEEQGQNVRVELVHISTVWYRVDLEEPRTK